MDKITWILAAAVVAIVTFFAGYWVGGTQRGYGGSAEVETQRMASLIEELGPIVENLGDIGERFTEFSEQLAIGLEALAGEIRRAGADVLSVADDIGSYLDGDTTDETPEPD